MSEKSPKGEESDHDDGPSTSTGAKKRKRSDAVDIPSQVQDAPTLPLWVAGGSPARFITPDDVMKMSSALDNLSVVHEIAIDPHFSVSDVPVNPIEKAVKENMFRAYFDLLRDDLAKDPPSVEHAFNLLIEIKQMILTDILSAQHVRLRAEVEVHLNEESLRDKLEQDCLNIQVITRFILNLLGRLCCAERDSIIESLRKEKDVISIIKGIFELLEVMKNDLTNFHLSQNRASIEEYSAKYEYDEFMKHLKDHPDDTKRTKEWLREAFDELQTDMTPSCSSDAPEAKREKTRTVDEVDEQLKRVSSRGYVTLVQSENPDPFPETLILDKMRLSALAEKFLQLKIVTTSVFVTCNLAGKEVSEKEGFKKKLKDNLVVITNDIDESSLKKVMEAVTEQCVKEVRTAIDELKQSFDEQRENLLRSQLALVLDTNNSVRQLVDNRIAKFVEEILFFPGEVPRRLLPGLSVIQYELGGFTGRLLRIGQHNRRTFAKLYKEIISSFESV